MNFTGFDSFVLKEKLKELKQVLKGWNKSSFGNIEVNIQNAISEIKVLDDKGESCSFSEGDILLRRVLFEKFWNFSRMRDTFVYQRSRLRWL